MAGLNPQAIEDEFKSIHYIINMTIVWDKKCRFILFNIFNTSPFG